MGQIREVDALSDAIIATEREIAGEAWDIEDTDPADETGDRTLESIGEGLEGQQEASEDNDAEGSEEQDAEESEDAEGEAEGETESEDQTGKAEAQRQQDQEPKGRVPSSEHRKLREERDAIRTERDGLKAEIETLKSGGASKGEIDALKTQVATLTQALQGLRPTQQRTEPDKPAGPKASELLFENPDGFVDQIQQGFKTELNGVLNTIRQNNVSMSFELAHVRHGESFPKAMEAVNKLDPNNPADRQIVQGIYNSPNPGEALVSWHRRSETLARVGNDPAAYEERIRNETRQSLLKDPEFRKQLMADLRQEANAGENGSPRNQNRLPPSLKRAPGASSQGERFDHSASDDSEQSVADAAWR